MPVDTEERAHVRSSREREGHHTYPDVGPYFGPTAAAGKESNWVQTIPREGFNLMLRLYGPLEPWFDKTWRPGEIEEVK